MQQRIPYITALDALTCAYGGISNLAASVSRTDLLAPSRCRGWVVADVLFHQLGDAQRALAAFATPVDGPSDRDLVSYWTGFAEDATAAGVDPVAGIWATKRATAAYKDGRGGVLMWSDTAPAAVRAAGRADPNGCIATQGHVLAVPDFIATLVTEAVIHHLDMIVDLPGQAEPADAAVAVATQTIDGLLDRRSPGATCPAGWTAKQYLLRATGREPATGPLADLFPVLR